MEKCNGMVIQLGIPSWELGENIHLCQFSDINTSDVTTWQHTHIPSHHFLLDQTWFLLEVVDVEHDSVDSILLIPGERSRPCSVVAGWPDLGVTISCRRSPSLFIKVRASVSFCAEVLERFLIGNRLETFWGLGTKDYSFRQIYGIIFKACLAPSAAWGVSSNHSENNKSSLLTVPQPNHTISL